MNERIKNTSKAGQKKAREAAVFAYAHKAWTYDDIYSAYKKPSVYKVRAWNWCKELCREMHGYDLIITGASRFAFSVVFTFNERGTGRKCYAYITRDYNRFCYADDVQQHEEKTVMQMTAA